MHRTNGQTDRQTDRHTGRQKIGEPLYVSSDSNWCLFVLCSNGIYNQ